MNFTASHAQYTSFAVEVGYCVFERGGVLEKLRSTALLSLHDVRPCTCAILYCHTIALISFLTSYTAFCKLNLPILHATETSFSDAPIHDYSWGLQLAFQTESRENQPHKNLLSTLMENKTWPTWYNWLHFTHFWLNWRVPKKKTM